MGRCPLSRHSRRAGNDLEEVAAGVLPVDAAAAVVDLAGPPPAGVGPPPPHGGQGPGSRDAGQLTAAGRLGSTNRDADVRPFPSIFLTSAAKGSGYRVPARRPRGHIILWRWLRQLRWPVALLALLPPRLVGRRLHRPVLHPRADGLEQPVNDGDGDRARPSDEGGGDDGVLQPDGHLDDSWTGDNKSRARVARLMPHPESDRGLLREALRPLPQADAVSWVAAP